MKQEMIQFYQTIEADQKKLKRLRQLLEETILKKEVLWQTDQEKASEKTLTLEEQVTLFKLVEDKQSSQTRDQILKSNQLLVKLVHTFGDLKKDLELNTEIAYYEQTISELLETTGHFSRLGDEMCHHQFIRIEDQLVCIHCEGQTDKNALSPEALDFLTQAANKQGLLLPDVTKEDLPLIQILKGEIADQNKYRTPLDEVDEDEWMVTAEEYWLTDEMDRHCIGLEVKRAHMLDEGIWERGRVQVKDPHYLTQEEATQFRQALEADTKQIEQSNSRFKPLLLEACQAVNYEIQILSGQSLPELERQTTTESQLAALTKAYYNLSNQEYRIESPYFKDETDAVFYTCRTANQKLNQKVLTMKRKNK